MLKYPRTKNELAAGKIAAYSSSAALEPADFQDLIDVLPDVLKAAAGVPLQFKLSVTLGDGTEVDSGTLEALNELLGKVSSNLRLKNEQPYSHPAGEPPTHQNPTFSSPGFSLCCPGLQERL